MKLSWKEIGIWLFRALISIACFLFIGVIHSAEKIEDRVNNLEKKTIQIESESEHVREILLRIEKKIDNNTEKLYDRPK